MKKTIANDLLIPEVGELISQGHSVTLTARGNSMNPFIVDRRDRIVLSPFTDAQLQPGAVVLAETKGHRYVLHRILHRHGDDLTLSGDGNLRQTEQTDIHHVIGLMTAVIRKEKTYNTEGRVWLSYSRWWKRLTPLRRYLLAVYRRIPIKQIK